MTLPFRPSANHCKATLFKDETEPDRLSVYMQASRITTNGQSIRFNMENEFSNKLSKLSGNAMVNAVLLKDMQSRMRGYASNRKHFLFLGHAAGLHVEQGQQAKPTDALPLTQMMATIKATDHRLLYLDIWLFGHYMRTALPIMKDGKTDGWITFDWMTPHIIKNSPKGNYTI